MARGPKYKVSVLRDAFGNVVRVNHSGLATNFDGINTPALLLIEFFARNAGQHSRFLIPQNGDRYPAALDLIPSAHRIPGSISLESASSGRFVASLPNKEGGSSIRANAFWRQDWEAFFLAEPYQLNDSVKQIVADAIALLNGPSPGPRLLEAIRHHDDSLLTAAEHCHHLIPWHALDYLVRSAEHWLTPSVAGNLARRDTSGRAAGLAMLLKLKIDRALQQSAQCSRLSHYSRGNPAQDSAPAKIGPSVDALQKDAWGEGCANLWHALVSSMRRVITPKRNLCILATVRNEGPYLIEWIAYHRLLGVEHFFIYTNDNEDGSNTVLELLHHNGIITLIHNSVPLGGSAQNKAYAHALSVDTQILDYHWCAVIDADEFIRLDGATNHNIVDFLSGKEFEEADALALSWRNMSPSEASTSRRSDLVLKDQFCYAEEVNLHVKCIIRPRKFIRSSPHIPTTDRRYGATFLAADGSEYRSLVDKDPKVEKINAALSAAPLCSPCYVAHYLFKSIPEFAVKRSKNGGDLPLTGGDVIMTVAPNQSSHFIETVTAQQQSAPLDDDIIRRLEENVLELKSIPNMKLALARCYQWRSERFAAVREFYKKEIPTIQDEDVKRFARLVINHQNASEDRR